MRKNVPKSYVKKTNKKKNQKPKKQNQKNNSYPTVKEPSIYNQYETDS